jgi:parallel beta-helix repeat protein
MQIAILFLAVLLWSCRGHAATYYAAPSGSDGSPCTKTQPCQTINKGVSLLRPGDTLYLRQGIYANQPLGYPSPQPLPSGNSWEQAITIASAPGETATLQGTHGITLLGNEHHIIFDRLVIQGTGLFLNCDAHHIRFQNGEIRDGVEINLISGCGSHLEVLNSKIHGASSPRGGNHGDGIGGGYGVYWSGRDSLFEGNEVYDNAGYGFHIYYGGHTTVSNNVLRNNRVYNNGFHGGSGGSGSVIIANGANNQFVNNLVYGNAMGVQVSQTCTNCIVEQNTIHDNKGFAVQDFGSGSRVSANWEGEPNSAARPAGMGANLSTIGTSTGGGSPPQPPPRPRPKNLRPRGIIP